MDAAHMFLTYLREKNSKPLYLNFVAKLSQEITGNYFPANWKGI